MTVSIKDAKCRGCYFFDRINDKPMGRCKRKSPVVFLVPVKNMMIGSSRSESDVVSAWPIIGEGDWCGEGEPISQNH